VTLVAPVSPFGFGGTHGTDGTLCDPAGAGSGAGSVHPDFVARLAARDRGAESTASPRQVLLAHYVKPPFVPAELDVFVESMLSTRVGDDHYPGTSRPVAAWPGFAPGDRGVLNTMAPTHFRIASLAGLVRKPPVLWLRGADDVIVSDTSLYDLGYLGSIKAVPGWPGPDAWPPQPMVAQTRALLDGYAAAGAALTVWGTCYVTLQKLSRFSLRASSIARLLRPVCPYLVIMSRDDHPAIAMSASSDPRPRATGTRSCAAAGACGSPRCPPSAPCGPVP
jgi:hypothetical protein